MESKPQIEKHLIVGYHNAVTVARLLGYDNILIPFFGMSLMESENEKMIKRIIKMFRGELHLRRRGMDIYFVIPEWMGYRMITTPPVRSTSALSLKTPCYGVFACDVR